VSPWSKSLIAVAVVRALVAAEPTPLAPWFAVDYATGYPAASHPCDWTESAGTWSATGAATGCTFTAASERAPAHLALNAVTNGWLGFTPSATAAAGVIVHMTTRAALQAFGAWETLPDLSAEHPRAALVTRERADHTLAYHGWTAAGWTELAGAEPDEDAFTEIRITHDDSTTPATVSYAAGGRTLVSAATGESVFAADGAPGAPTTLLARGTIALADFGASRELPERTAAVIAQDGSFTYRADLAEALADARTHGGTARLLRRTTVSAAATALGTPLRLADNLLTGGRAPLAFAPDVTGELLLELPDTVCTNVPVASPAAALAHLHIHGADGLLYTLTPDATLDTVRLSSETLARDDGNFLAWTCLPEDGRAFARHLAADRLGTNRQLAVQGLGRLTLCGTNALSGGLIVESGHVDFCTPAAEPAGPVRIETHGGATLPGTNALSRTTAEEGAALALDLTSLPPTAIANNAVVADETAAAGCATAECELTVTGERLAYARRVTGLGLVAKVAEAPAFAASEAGFRCVPDPTDPARACLSATVANAVTGFRYGWLAADAPTDVFAPAGTVTEATADGPLALDLNEPKKSARFYRLTVSR